MDNFDPKKLILIHGLEGSSQGDKAVLLRSIFPEMITPDFSGTVAERMELLESLLGDQSGWTIVGSSLGGLMAALFATQRPTQVRKLILLAPALFLPEFSDDLPQPVDIPTIIVHGSLDTIVPLESTRLIAEKVFLQLTFLEVEDDHRLFQTTQQMDWKKILN